jgi:hypothetical protein
MPVSWHPHEHDRVPALPDPLDIPAGIDDHQVQVKRGSNQRGRQVRADMSPLPGLLQPPHQVFPPAGRRLGSVSLNVWPELVLGRARVLTSRLVDRQRPEGIGLHRLPHRPVVLYLIPQES